MKTAVKILRHFLLTLIPVFGCIAISAQAKIPSDIFQNVTSNNLFSEVLNEERTLFIYLPESYTEEKSYPVLYLLDGEMTGPYEEALTTVKGSDIREHIIVGIKTNINRNRDMIPVKIETREGSGGAEQFLKFLTSELIPFINSNYRTSGFNILYGASNAGLFTIYALLKAPESFDAYLSSSSMIGHCPDYMNKLAEQTEPGLLDHKILYIHWGMKDYFPQVTEYLPGYYKKLIGLFEGSLITDIKGLAEGEHVPPGGILEGMKFIYENVNSTPE
ncbi:MAG: alpha/beta hydrolase-fold protein [Bacteroidales bacterium]|jgi:predicted alpha/beta superfamily hydrolase|nr:alpha/beta hydrolase-fold protein [Bacteroidales bacterium]